MDQAPVTWDEWKRKNEGKFLDSAGKPLPEAIRTMIAYNGRLKGKKVCQDCIHCIAIKRPGTQNKLHLTCDESNQKADWQKDWPACGKYKARKEELTNP